ncbi:DDB1- and CUL4-associated factor 8 isoform X1 [Drosophila teissieri]|uniref:DDB1- and CUL4-associated factor 8 isoform X1 n=1 Tax=Drosophila teissieri TaxID=7243 RepID=UPI001CBA24EC|nr:DDB1- and CUL4-associated factor 8 isoform X1 [Drosophila teissieri]
MDVEKDSVASGAASACKRQRRNTDSQNDGKPGDEAQVGEESTVVANQPLINCDAIATNNNNEERDMAGKEHPLQEEKEQPEKDSANDIGPQELPDLEQAGSSNLGYQLSPAAASAVLAANESEATGVIEPIDSDDDPPTSPTPGEAAEAVTTHRFNPRNIPATRSYRRISIELVGTVTDSESSDSQAPEAEEETEHAEEDSDDVADPHIAESAEDSSSNDDMVRYSLSSEDDTTTEVENLQDEVEFNEHVNAADREKVDYAVDEVMSKCKPKYTWNYDQELLQREHNIINRIGWRGGHTSSLSFGQGYYGSRQVVEQLTLLSSLNDHDGCVNCLNFNRTGDLICSGSDDLNIVVWDWAKEKQLHRFRSGHNMNIFQTKFIDSAGCLDIVSASRDGQVRRSVIPPSGGAIKPVRLYTHSESVHKIVLVPHSRHELMSAGEDAAVKHFDLRASNAATTMLRCVYNDENKRGRVRLFSIAHHPYAPEFCISGSDDVLRVYDKRNLKKTLVQMTPSSIAEAKITQITCAVYNHSGSEILASYSDAGIYLFDSRNNKDGEYLHCYQGHINSRTIKGVNFFGPRSEYIVSGSDCGNIFFWDRNTEAIINYMKGDHAGVVNCLEPHPWMPVLATSGLEHDVKIWTPNGPERKVPDEDSLKQTLQRNFRRNLVDSVDIDINGLDLIRGFLQVSEGSHLRPRHASWQGRRPRDNSSSPSDGSNPSNPVFRRRSSNSSDDTNDEGVDAAAALDTMLCRTQ